MVNIRPIAKRPLDELNGHFRDRRCSAAFGYSAVPDYGNYKSDHLWMRQRKFTYLLFLSCSAKLYFSCECMFLNFL